MKKTDKITLKTLKLIAKHVKKYRVEPVRIGKHDYYEFKWVSDVPQNAQKYGKVSGRVSKSEQREHILSKNCWCNPKVIKVKPSRPSKQSVNKEKHGKRVL